MKCCPGCHSTQPCARLRCLPATSVPACPMLCTLCCAAGVPGWHAVPGHHTGPLEPMPQHLLHPHKHTEPAHRPQLRLASQPRGGTGGGHGAEADNRPFTSWPVGCLTAACTCAWAAAGVTAIELLSIYPVLRTSPPPSHPQVYSTNRTDYNRRVRRLAQKSVDF